MLISSAFLHDIKDNSLGTGFHWPANVQFFGKLGNRLSVVGDNTKCLEYLDGYKGLNLRSNI